MSFTSFWFLFFIIGLLLLRCCARGYGAEKWLLLAASIAFYLTWNIPCVLLVLCTSLLDFYVARNLGQSSDPAGRKRWLVTSLVSNLCLLGFFKYANFFLENGRVLIQALSGHVRPLHYDITVPPGISYFTFAGMSYVLDVYYERLAPCGKARDYTLFISFFPKVLSGPIIRAVDFLPQLERRAKARLEGIEAGAAQFLIGAIKKAVLADQIAGNVNQIFSGASQFDSFTLLEGMLGFAAQLYCDFSGYSDMAIGCARVLGFEFAENFQMPFSSVSITEFWRRWHITMSSWFRDYLFLPLEIATRSNPMPLLRMSLNITLTMLLCGLWHGPSWNYVIYGGVHGVALAGHKVWTSCKPAPAWVKGRAVEFLANLAARGLTLGVVVLSLVFFRTATVADAMTYLSRMFSAGHQGERMFSMYIYPVVGVVFLAHLLINKDRNLALELPRMSVGVRVAAYAFLLTVLVSLGATEGAPFVYFKF